VSFAAISICTVPQQVFIILHVKCDPRLSDGYHNASRSSFYSNSVTLYQKPTNSKERKVELKIVIIQSHSSKGLTEENAEKLAKSSTKTN